VEIYLHSPTRLDGTLLDKTKPRDKPCHSTGGSSPGQVMWDLWWTKWHWGQVFSEYFGFPCQFSFHQILRTHLSSGAGTIGQFVVALWSSGQSSWLRTQRTQVRFPALPDFLRSSGSGTGSTQPREDS
jgi:hypothetical protein